MAKTYIWDGVFAEYEDGELLLTREDKKGRVSDVIPLDTSSLMLLVQFLRDDASDGVVAMLHRMLRPDGP